MASIGPVLTAIAQRAGAAVAANPAVITSTTIALVAQAALNALATRKNIPLTPVMQAVVQLTSASLGIITAHLIGLTVAPELLLVAILAPIVIRYIGSNLFAAPQAPAQGLELPKGQVAIAENELATLRKDLQALRDGAAAGAEEAVKARIAELEKRAEISPEDLTTLREQVAELGKRAEISPEDLTTLREQVAELGKRAEISPEDLTTLREQVAELGKRAEISPEDLTTLREQVAELGKRAEISPEDLTTLREKVAELGKRAEISPGDLATLREQVAELGKRAEISPQDLATLRKQVTELGKRAEITPEGLAALREQVTALEAKMTTVEKFRKQMTEGAYKTRGHAATDMFAELDGAAAASV